MKSEASTPEAYLESLPEDRKPVMQAMMKTIKAALPPGFEEVMSYGMIGYVVPHSLYPSGYHCDAKLPLPFINLASQKNFIALYHMGLYASNELMDWFQEQWPKYSSKKLDMGKSCIRFKKPEDVPMELISLLCSKMTVKQWVERYESVLNSRKT